MLMNKLKFYIVLMLSVFVLLQGCAPVPKKEPKIDIKKEVIKKPVVAEVKEIVKEVPQQYVLVLLSSSAKPYQMLADEIARSVGEYVSQVTLTGKTAHDKSIINEVKASNATQIVAVGLLAAKAVKGIKNKQVIFTHVVNYSDNKLVTENSKGVSGLPSPELLFKDWRKLSPKLSTVAIISGKNLDVYLTRAKKAAKKQGIKLHLEQVTTDKEFIYKSKSLKSVDGQWILPDNRVLSAKALKEVMAYGSRRGRQIVVFSPKLLSFGGFFYVQPDESEMAKVVLRRLSDSAGKITIPGDGVLPVMSHTMGINQNIARQFNLIIPDIYRKNINGE